MLSFERRVVDSLLVSVDEQRRTAVTEYVDGALSAMPEHIRAGVAGQSVVLGGWAAVRRVVGTGGNDGSALIASLEASPIGLIRQYVRLLRYLVLFAEHEMAETAGA